MWSDTTLLHSINLEFQYRLHQYTSIKVTSFPTRNQSHTHTEKQVAIKKKDTTRLVCKKRYAMSSLSTASISCLAINQSIKKGNKKKRSSSVFPRPVYLFSDDRWRDIKIDEAAIKLLNWFHLAPTSCFIDMLWWSIESRTIGGYFSNLSRFVSCPIIVDKKTDINLLSSIDGVSREAS